MGAVAAAVRRPSAFAQAVLLGGLLLVVAASIPVKTALAEQPAPAVRLAAHGARIWLTGQQNENGSFGQRSPWRDSDLAVQALGQLDQDAAARLSSWLDTAPANVDYLARKVATSARLGSVADSDTVALLAAQQADGGFPLSDSYTSDTLDTVLALRALSAAATATAQQQRAVEYLVADANADGGWSYAAGGPSDVGLTSEILAALARRERTGLPVAGLAETIQAASSLLVQSRSNDGGWGSVAHTALAFTALSECGATFDESSTVGWLLARQLEDGSFVGGRVRETALAIQALDRADRNVAVTELAVSDAAPRQGGVVRVTAVLTNDGHVDVTGIAVRLAATSGGVSQELARFTVANLSANASTTVSYNYDTATASGTVDFEVVADPDAVVFETSETDNRGSTAILVRTPLLAPILLSPDYAALLDESAPAFAWVAPTAVDPANVEYVLQLDRSGTFDSAFAFTHAVSSSTGALVSYQLPAGVTLTDGTWCWRVRAAEGELDSPWSTARTLRVDRTPPVISGLTGSPSPFSPNGDGARDSLRATFQVSEPCTGSVAVLSSGGQLIGFAREGLSFDAGHAVFDWDGTLAVAGVLASGTYRLRVVLADAAGNETSATSGPTALDTTPPSLSGFSSTATSMSPNADGLFDRVTFAWTMSPDSTMTVRITDPTGKLLRVDQTKAQTYTWDGKTAQNLVVPSADYDVSFTCEDEAGNAAEQVVRSIKVRTACLVGSPSVAPLVVRPGEPVDVSVPVHDESSVAATVSGTPLMLTQGPTGDSVVARLNAPTAPGNYPISVEARDSLGNVTRPTGTALIVRASEVTGSVWLQDTKDDFAGPTTDRSTVDSTTIEARQGSVELSTLGWERLSDMPVPRYGAQTCLGPDGLIYVIGGTYEQSMGGSWSFHTVRNTSVFDPVTDTWTERAQMPSAREEGRAVFAPNGKIYVIGGIWVDSSGYTHDPTATVECYDPATDTWERDTDHGGTLAPMPTARGVFGAAVGSDGRIYCVGGYAGTMGDGGSTDVVEVYDPVTNTWETRAPMPQKECCFAAAGLNNSIYVLEGEYRRNSPTSTVDTKLSAGWSYDTALDEWQGVQSSPVARTDSICSTGRDGRVYVYGGSSTLFNSVGWTYGYSPLNNDWVRAADMPLGTERTQGVSDVSGRPYAFGGSYESYGLHTFACVQRYDPYYRATGEFVSQPKYLGRPSSFGAVTWDGDVPEGAGLTLATRTSFDKSTWSEWSDEYLVSGSSVSSPVGTYVQYRITMHTADPLKSPRVDTVAIVYNGAPAAPGLYGRMFRTPWPSIGWTRASDPETDPVTYDLQIDSVGSFDSPELRDYREIDPAIVTAPEYQVPSDEALADGSYWMRVRASDGRAQSLWTTAQSLRIDSTPPNIAIDSLDPSTVSVKEYGAVRSGVTYSVDETATVRLDIMQPSGSTYTSARQYLIYNVPPGAHTIELDGLTTAGQPLASGTYRLDLRATDALSNESVVDRASLTVRRAPSFSTLVPSVDSSDPDASCEAVVTIAGNATNVSMKVGEAIKVLVDSDANTTFTGRLGGGVDAGEKQVDDLVAEDALSGYRTVPASGKLSMAGYVAGTAWRESSQADFADGLVIGAKVGAGLLTLETAKWRTTGYSLLTVRSEAAAAQIGSRVYVIGGSGTAVQQTAEVIDLATGERTYIAPPLYPRRSAVAVPGADGRVYVFGGNGSGGLTGERYDPVSNAWQSFSIPVARLYSTAFTAPNGLIYLVGGTNKTSVQALNPSTMTWTTKSPPLTGVYNAAGCLFGDKYYMFGGFTGSGKVSDLQIYDIPSDTWSSGPSLPGPWYGHQVQKSVDGKAYIFGRGLTWGSSTLDCQCWSFDPATGVYAPRERPVNAAASPVSASYEGVIHLIGGKLADASGAPNESYAVAPSGSYVSSSYDAGQLVDWSTIGWTSFEPSGTTATVQTRSSVDGSTWSDWAGSYRTGDQVVSPSGRFIQYRVTLASANAPWVPTLGDITIGIDGGPVSGITAPMPERPSGAVFDAVPELAWVNATGGISRHYEVQLDRSPSFDGSGLRTFADIPELTGSSLLYLPSSSPLADGRWYWRVRATDGMQNSNWSPATEFDVVTRPALAIESLTAPDAEEGADLAPTAVVANHGAAASGCSVRFEDATSGDTIGTVDGFALGHEATAAVSVPFVTQGKSGTRTLSASIVSPTDDDPSNDSTSTIVNISPHGLSASVAPDRMAYAAEETVTLTVSAANAGTLARDVQVSLRVLDAEGVLVEDVGTPTALHLEATQVATYAAEWNTHAIYPGDYIVEVTLAKDGRTCFTSQAPFAIAEHVSLSGRVSVDRIAYDARDRVQVSSRVSNASSNAAFSDLRVKTKVLDSAGAVLASSETTIDNLQRGEAKLYGLAWDVEDAEPGEYSATEEVVLADGSVVVTGTTGFEVLPSSQTGAGLSAALDATPGVVLQGEACTFAYSLANDGNSSMDIPLTLSLVDPEASGTVLAELTSSTTVAEDGTAQGEFVIDTSDLPRVTEGTYLLAVLQGDLGGNRLTFDSAPVRVLPVFASATLATDASEYDALSSLNITATVSNETTTGYTLDGVEVELRLTGPDGTLVADESRTVAHLAHGEPASEALAWETDLHPPGTYQASVSVTYRGMLLSTASTQFVVLSTAQTGTGLSGQITLEKHDLFPGDALNAEYVISNDGNSGLAPLPTVVSLEDAVTGEVLAEQPLSLDLPRGGIATGTATFATDALLPDGESRQLVVRLRATVERATLQLASADAVVQQGVRISLTKRVTSMSRVLVWTETQANRQLAEQALTDLGAYCTIVDTPDAFITEMRSGLFDTLVILDTKKPLTAHFDEEVAERVNSGATLIGTRWANMDNLKGQGIFGVTFNGFLTDATRHITVPASSATTARTLDATGKAQKLTAAGAQVVASCDGNPMITVNDLGRGIAVLFAFDLAGTDAENGAGLLRDAIVGCPPEEGPPDADDIAVVEVSAANLGVATTVRIDETAAGATIVRALGTTAFDAQTATWTRTVGSGEMATVRYLVRLDGQGATALLSTDASADRSGVPTSVATSTLSTAPRYTATELASDAVARLTAITTTSKADSQIKERSLKVLRAQAADPPVGWGEHGQAIGDLVGVCTDLSRISADTSAARLAVDELMRLYGARWLQ